MVKKNVFYCVNCNVKGHIEEMLPAIIETKNGKTSYDCSLEKNNCAFLEMYKKLSRIELDAVNTKTILSLPAHLQKTFTQISKLGKATAGEVSEKTKRARAVESGYLNQLVVMDYLKKDRQKKPGGKVYFQIK